MLCFKILRACVCLSAYILVCVSVCVRVCVYVGVGGLITGNRCPNCQIITKESSSFQVLLFLPFFFQKHSLIHSVKLKEIDEKWILKINVNRNCQDDRSLLVTFCVGYNFLVHKNVRARTEKASKNSQNVKFTFSK